MATLTERAGWRTHPALFSGAVVGALVLIIAISAATLDIIFNLHTMTAELGTVSQRLDSLDTMSHKLDRLATMQQRLDHMDGSLTAMGASLGQTNAKLDQMRVLTTDMKKLDTDLQSMRGDIHTMAHKIGGSFLFKAVK
jgi:hypothetical protein